MAAAGDHVTVEIIVVDDKSDDDERLTNQRTCQSFNCHFVPMMVNVGCGEARNAGLSLANGKYVKFTDSDDELLPMSLYEEITYLESSPADLLVSGYIRQHSNNSKTTYPPKKYTNNNPIDALLNAFGAPISSVLYRKSILNGVKWQSRIKHPDDWLFLIEVLKKEPILHLRNRPVFIWIDHNQPRVSSSTSAVQYARNRYEILLEIWLFAEERGGINARQVQWICDYHYKDIYVAYRQDRELYNTILSRIKSLDRNYKPSRKAAGGLGSYLLTRVIGIQHFVVMREIIIEGIKKIRK